MERISIQNTSGREFFNAELAKNNILHCRWVGFVDELEPTKNACLAMVSAIQSHGCMAVINDNSQQKGPWPKLDEWFKNMWIGGMANAGLKYLAQIHSDNVFTEMSAKKILNDQYKGIEIAHFKSEVDAQRWILSKINN